MLVVMAIMAIMAVLLVPSVLSVLAARSFTQALDTITNSAAFARQTAVGNGAPAALVLVAPSGDQPGAVMVVQSKWNGTKLTYSAASPWKLLPTGNEIKIDIPDFLPPDADISVGTPKKDVDGVDISKGYKFIRFQPDGSVESDVKSNQGSPSPSITLTQQRGGKNQYEVTIQANTGRSKLADLLQ